MADENYIERVFNLGEYNSIRVAVVDPFESSHARTARVLAVYEDFFLSQIIRYELQDEERNVQLWTDKLNKLNELKTKYLGEI